MTSTPVLLYGSPPFWGKTLVDLFGLQITTYADPGAYKEENQCKIASARQLIKSPFLLECLKPVIWETAFHISLVWIYWKSQNNFSSIPKVAFPCITAWLHHFHDQSPH